MTNMFRTIAISTAIIVLSACANDNAHKSTALSSRPAQQTHETQSNQASGDLRIATWNVEHLAYPINTGCKPRSEAELQALRTYARNVNADIVALQEVASKEAVHLLFPENEWTVIMSSRPDSQVYHCRESGALSTQQKTAIAVKKSIVVNNVEQNDVFALDNDGLRFGLGMSVYSKFGNIDVLNLHMKSGCFVDDYSRSDTESCQTFSQQVEVLYDWIAKRDELGKAYIILGDFNHRLSAPYNKVTRTLAQHATLAKSSIEIVTAPLLGCHPRYPAPIDHIIAGGFSSKQLAHKVYVHKYNGTEEEAMLSDHCAVSVKFSKPEYSLSSAVKWQVQSKEYEIITKGLYQAASERIAKKSPSDKPWVVVMDLDETVLDNSAYQVGLDLSNTQYTSATWDEWIKSQKAGLVPGVDNFIQTVLSKGGKLVFITNRDKSLDAYTWANIQMLGLGVSEQNTCLMGRQESDVNATNASKYVNDKDLRRESISTGTAACFSETKTLVPEWQTPHAIVMQVGDNIEDINAVSQENANINMLLQRFGADIVILPNPMYGSW
jgi:5'-nucleotidase (lipoprotein e(P4) family)